VSAQPLGEVTARLPAAPKRHAAAPGASSFLLYWSEPLQTPASGAHTWGRGGAGGAGSRQAWVLGLLSAQRRESPVPLEGAAVGRDILATRWPGPGRGSQGWVYWDGGQPRGSRPPFAERGDHGLFVVMLACPPLPQALGSSARHLCPTQLPQKSRDAQTIIFQLKSTQLQPSQTG